MQNVLPASVLFSLLSELWIFEMQLNLKEFIIYGGEKCLYFTVYEAWSNWMYYFIIIIIGGAVLSP
jgi:hypothetical protein